MKTSWLGLIALLAGACGSSSSSNIDGGLTAFDAPIVSAGTATLTGGQTGTVMVNVTGVKGDADSFTAVAMASYGTLPANIKGITVAFKFNGTPTVKDYLPADLTGAATIMTNDNKVYAAGSGVGSFGKLTLTAQSGINHSNGVTVYRLNGSWSATLVNAASATDTITLNVTF
jgi:hypothetical protein